MTDVLIIKPQFAMACEIYRIKPTVFIQKLINDFSLIDIINNNSPLPEARRGSTVAILQLYSHQNLVKKIKKWNSATCATYKALAEEVLYNINSHQAR